MFQPLHPRLELLHREWLAPAERGHPFRVSFPPDSSAQEQIDGFKPTIVGYKPTMNLLTLLFPQVRAEILRLLFAEAGRELHLRDLTRQSGLSIKTVQNEFAKLSAIEKQTKIAKMSLRLSELGVSILGGMTREEAREHLKKQRWSDARIAKWENA